MKFGLILPQDTDDPAHTLRAAQLSEEAGLDSIWVVDNLQERPDPSVPFLESWTSLCAAAAATSRIAVGTMVQRVTLRNPRVAAAMASTLERIAPGRLILALGVGDSSSREEQNAFGIEFKPKAARFARLSATVGALRDEVPDVPLWLGGESDECIDYVGRFDGWNFWGPAQKFPERAQRAREAAGGRSLELTWAGPWRDFDMAPLRQGGASHVIIATNTGIYEKRINMVKQLIDDDALKETRKGAADG